MKWYFASRIRHKNLLLEVCEFLQDRGEIIASDWIYQDSLKPYDLNLPKVQPFSQEVVKNILAADIFVLISDPEGTDMFIELGIALAKNNINSNNKIYAVGEHSKRSLMQLHPAIIHVPTLEELFKQEGIEGGNFNLS